MEGYMNKPVCTDGDIIREFFKQNWDTNETAKACGITTRKVGAALKRAGMSFPKRSSYKNAEEQLEEVGMSSRDFL